MAETTNFKLSGKILDKNILPKNNTRDNQKMLLDSNQTQLNHSSSNLKIQKTHQIKAEVDSSNDYQETNFKDHKNSEILINSLFHYKPVKLPTLSNINFSKIELLLRE